VLASQYISTFIIPVKPVSVEYTSEIRLSVKVTLLYSRLCDLSNTKYVNTILIYYFQTLIIDEYTLPFSSCIAVLEESYNPGDDVTKSRFSSCQRVSI